MAEAGGGDGTPVDADVRGSRTRRWRRRAAIAAVLTGAFWLAGSEALPPAFTIETEIVLPAPRERAWSALADLPAHAEWNPYMPRAEAKLEPGETLSFTIVDDNFEDPLDLTATLGEVRPPEALFWRGRALVRGLHDTKHGFVLVERDDGTTHFRHYEEFRGVLAWLLAGATERREKTRTSHARMNAALRDRLAGESR